ncbi:ATP-dependent nuclease [Microcoleus sp. FACHB-672]|uniref:ATP-dependent nuclease n=1 Tax=Microcoleus sp. FACHB-672 TaxID=2692825 RepID=UPI0016838F41|nr:ATP-binding protein [Microcoleus sp. FACHB-672]MBD2039158.1 AAA family ATPase [Microcoleus sp. FACHB-672]
MPLEITIKNYRCFSDSNPARFIIQKGFTAFIGVNNSGKSSLLKFFYEFRSLFTSVADPSSFQNAIYGTMQSFSFPREVLDMQEVFCNVNERPLTIQVIFFSEDGAVEKDNLPIAEKIVFTIPRNNTYTAQLYSANKILPSSAKHRLNHMVWMEENRPLAEDTPLANVSDLIKSLRDLGNTLYIGPFRNVLSLIAGSQTTLGYLDYFDIKVGQAFIQQWRWLKTGPDRKFNSISMEITNFLQDFFKYKKVEINASNDDQTLKFFIDEKPYTISELGSGLSQFFLVLANAAIKEPSYILIDEPELNLHPSLQLDFLTTLGQYASQGVFFATHSIGLARASAERIYTVRKGDESSEVIEYEKSPSLVEFLGELSFSTYREFGFDKVLMVEGRTEIKTMQQFLRKYGKDHEILILSLGGSSFITPDSQSELEEVKRISENIFVLIDSEKKSMDAPLELKRQDFLEMCQEIEINCHVLERRATENYFTDRAIKQVKGEKYGVLGPYDKLENAPHGWKKAENWRIAQEMSKEELEATDLGKFIKNLCGIESTTN